MIKSTLLCLLHFPCLDDTIERSDFKAIGAEAGLLYGIWPRVKGKQV